MNISRLALIAALIAGALIVSNSAGSPSGEPWWSVAAQSDDEDVRVEVGRYGHITISDTGPNLGERVTVETYITGRDGAAATGVGVALNGYLGEYESSDDLPFSYDFSRLRLNNNGRETIRVRYNDARTMTYAISAFGNDAETGERWHSGTTIFHVTWAGTAPQNTATPTATATSVAAPTATSTPTPTATATATATATPTPTYTATATATSTATPTATATATVTSTPTASPTATASATPTPTPAVSVVPPPPGSCYVLPPSVPGGTRSTDSCNYPKLKSGLSDSVCHHEAWLRTDGGQESVARSDVPVRRVQVYVILVEGADTAGIRRWLVQHDPGKWSIYGPRYYGDWRVIWEAPLSLLGMVAERDDVEKVLRSAST